MEEDGEKALFDDLHLLSAKPIIYAANLSEDDLLAGIGENPYYPVIRDIAAAEGAGCMPICAKTEEDIAGLTPAEKKEFLAELGLEASGLDNLIRESYALLGLISFLTAGEPEVRAWTIKKAPRPPRRRARSTRILSAASSGPRSWPTTT